MLPGREILVSSAATCTEDEDLGSRRKRASGVRQPDQYALALQSGGQASAARLQPDFL